MPRWTYNVGKFAFGAAQRGYDEYTAAIVITATEDDPLPVGRPVCAAHETSAGVCKPQRFLAADQLHVKIPPAPVSSIPEVSDLSAVGRKHRIPITAGKAGDLGDAHL